MSVDLPELTQSEINLDHNHTHSVSTGQYLKSLRLGKNMTEDDVCHYLKIKPRIIRAIENHHYDCLPDTATVCALVKQYAKFLGLNGTDVAHNYKTEMSGTEQKIDVTFPDKLPSSFKPAKRAFLITFLLMIGFGLWNFLNSTNSLLPDFQTTPKHQDLIANSDDHTQSSSDDGFKRIFAEIKPFIHFKIITMPKFKIEAHNGEAWIEVKDTIKKQIIFSGILRDGDTYIIPQDIPGLILKAGNIAPLLISRNGQPLDVLPKTNRVLRNFSLNAEELVKLEEISKKLLTEPTLGARNSAIISPNANVAPVVAPVPVPVPVPSGVSSTPETVQ